MLKKLLKIILLILLMTLMHITANAEEDYMLKKFDKVPNVYVTKINQEHQIFDYMYIIARSSDNAFVYCVEPGIHIDSTAKYYGVNDISNSKLTKEQYEKIKLISYYGYGYQDANINHTDKIWYAVTQGLIWEVESNNHEIYFTNYLQGPKVDKFLNEYQEINNLINSHYIKPSFTNTTKEMSLGETITLTDTNNVIDSYSISTSNNNIFINKEGNNLQITALKEGSTTITLTKEFKYYNTNPLIYTAPNSQTLFKVGNLEPINNSLNINITGNKVIINKVDSDTEKFESISDASLIGAVYGLYDDNNNLLEKLTINSNGISTSNNILKLNENYYLKEITPSKGYELDEDKHYFTVNSKETFITLKEKIIKRIVNIHKSTNELTNIPSSLEEGIIFNIYHKSTNTLYNTITTNDKGFASIELPFGTYIFKQQNTTNNYDKVKDFEIVIDKADIPIDIKLTDKLISSKIKVIKTDSETKKIIPLSNIIFKIRNKDTNEYICENSSCDFSTLNGTFTTLNSLPFGTYRLEEISSIEGYQVNNKPLEFTINESSSFKKEDNDIILELQFANTPIYGSLELIKINNKNELLSNALINIYNENKDLILSDYTNDEGKIILNNLKYGVYYYQEIKPPKGYILDNNIYSFKVSNHNENIRLTLVNEKEEIPDPPIEIVEVPNTYKDSYYSNIFPIFIFFYGLKLLTRKKKLCTKK